MLGCLPLLQAGVSASMEFRDGGVIIEPCPSTVRDQQVRARASDQQFDKAKGIAEEGQMGSWLGGGYSFPRRPL